ncbi:8831_t:CDS:2 [Diversispora eburnea]|uniref:8831_t:CDS:1 n=1 Tax=Diversispora eburnea TaxID=1213867 RepID=A0A9N8YYL1_9GLOM|nr:8831_t:CDS:2 [Diversispora eburnea]
MVIENISDHGRIGLLWSQRDNLYVGYLDFEDEKKEFINTLTAHEINKILFQLAANLECINIHTFGSICDATNLDRSKFTVHLLDPSFSNEMQVDRNLLRPPMPIKQNWIIDDLCIFLHYWLGTLRIA